MTEREAYEAYGDIDRIYFRQVKLSYGPRTSGNLLLSYGFAPAPQDNPYDACPLRLALHEDDALFEAKAEALRHHGLEPSQVGCITEWVLKRVLQSCLELREGEVS